MLIGAYVDHFVAAREVMDCQKVCVVLPMPKENHCDIDVSIMVVNEEWQ